MTVTTIIRRTEVVGDGVSAQINCPWTMANEDWIKVWEDGVQLSTAHYTVTIENDWGGYVTLDDTTVSGSAGLSYVVLRDVPITQETDYKENDPFPAEVHEDDLDKSTMIDQQLQESLDRVISYPEGEPIGGFNMEFPTPLVPLYHLGVNAAGTAMEWQDPSGDPLATASGVWTIDGANTYFTGGNVAVGMTTYPGAFNVTGQTYFYGQMYVYYGGTGIKFLGATAHIGFSADVNLLQMSSNDSLGSRSSNFFCDSDVTVEFDGDVWLDGTVHFGSTQSFTNVDIGGNLQVDGNILVDGTVDGVDIAAFKTAFDTQVHDATEIQSEAVSTATPEDGQSLVYSVALSEWVPTLISGTSVSGVGVTDHGALFGLADNDHPQYLLTTDFTIYSGTLQTQITQNTNDISANTTNIATISGAYYSHADDDTIHFEAGATDHGGLAGLGDDDHVIYIKADGERGFEDTVGGIYPTLDGHIATKEYVDDTMATISGVISDHGILSGLTDDDHTLYIKADGTRQFSGKVGGIYPTGASHLTTKEYVDDEILTLSGSIVLDHGGLLGLGDDDHPQYLLTSDFTTYSGTLQTQIDANTTLIGTTSGTLQANIDALDYYTTGQVDTISGALSQEIADEISGSGHLSNIVEDTTPQLGGHLDVNGKRIQQDADNYLSFELDSATLVTEASTVISALDDGSNYTQTVWSEGQYMLFEFMTGGDYKTWQFDSNGITLNSGTNMQFGVNTISGTGDIYAGNLFGDGSNLTGIVVGSGTTHSALSGLDYASAGHTGFQPAGDYTTNAELTSTSGVLQTNLDNHAATASIHRVLDDGTISSTTLWSSEKINTVSGALQTNINGKSDTGHGHISISTPGTSVVCADSNPDTIDFIIDGGGPRLTWHAAYVESWAAPSTYSLGTVANPFANIYVDDVLTDNVWATATISGTDIYADTFYGDGSNLTGIVWATDKIEEGNTYAEVIDTGSDGHFLVRVDGAERMRLTGGAVNHTLTLGTSASSPETGYTFTMRNEDDNSGLAMITHHDSEENLFTFKRSRGTYSSKTAVQDTDVLGTIHAAGWDGSIYNHAGRIEFIIDGATGVGDMPTRLNFYTGLAQNPTNRLSIAPGGTITYFANTISGTGDIYAGNFYGTYTHNHDGDYSALGHNHSGTYLENIVEDTTPQLGGNLDVNDYDITSASGVELHIIPGTNADWSIGDAFIGEISGGIPYMIVGHGSDYFTLENGVGMTMSTDLWFGANTISGTGSIYSPNIYTQSIRAIDNTDNRIYMGEGFGIGLEVDGNLFIKCVEDDNEIDINYPVNLAADMDFAANTISGTGNIYAGDFYGTYLYGDRIQSGNSYLDISTGTYEVQTTNLTIQNGAGLYYRLDTSSQNHTFIANSTTQLTIDTNGLTAGNDIIANASGTLDIGEVAVPFQAVYADSFYGDGSNLTGVAGSGETNTMSNLGAGEGVYYQKAGVEFEMKSLVGGDNISLTSDNDTITISGSAGGGGVSTKWTTNTQTTTGTVTVNTTDSSETFVSTVAAGTVTYNLPSVGSGDVGTWYSFAKTASGTLTIDANDSDTIAESAAGGTLSNSVGAEIYATVTVQLVTETKWMITGGHGYWVAT